MAVRPAQSLHARYTALSDRFRSIWTFYQFLGGVFKHLERGQVPATYDFQELFRRLQGLVPLVAHEGNTEAAGELDRIERELDTIAEKLDSIEGEFSPALFRRFFDRLKRQDDKILFALAKFYLNRGSDDRDTLDKLDILLTRIAEVPAGDDQVLPRDREALRETFASLVRSAEIPEIDADEARTLVKAAREYRGEIESVAGFEELLTGGVLDRYRVFKSALGRSFLWPPVLVEIVTTNISATNQFRSLYQEEEAKILEDTNRILEIERYLEANPEVAHEELRQQIDTFRRFRSKLDSSRRSDNIRREDLLELRRTIHGILDHFDPTTGAIAPEREPTGVEPAGSGPPTEAAGVVGSDGGEDVVDAPSDPDPEPETPAEQADTDSIPAAGALEATDELEPAEVLEVLDDQPVEDDAGERLLAMLPSDPVVREPLHTIISALELVGWDYTPQQAAYAKELHNLHLEPWEIEAYRHLHRGRIPAGTLSWERELFLLTAAALRVRLEQDAAELEQRRSEDTPARETALASSAAALARSRPFEERFQWFLDDILYRGETDRLAQVLRSRFRFLEAYAHLWLLHHAVTGSTPPI